MPPKRARAKATTLGDDTVAALLESHCDKMGGLKLGRYESLTTGSSGHSIPDILVWYSFVFAILAAAPSAIVCWKCIKNAILVLYDKFPRWDPFLKHREHTNVSSAEWMARRIGIPSFTPQPVEVFWKWFGVYDIRALAEKPVCTNITISVYGLPNNY